MEVLTTIPRSKSQRTTAFRILLPTMLLFTQMTAACGANTPPSAALPANNEATALAAAVKTATSAAIETSNAGNISTHTAIPSLTSPPSPQPTYTTTPTWTATHTSEPTLTPIPTSTPVYAYIDLATYRDKLEGGWIGQMAGVQWGAPTEFRYQGIIMPEKVEWVPESINGGLENDDLYAELPFLITLYEQGVTSGWDAFGENFRWTGCNLWHANKTARDNLQNDIPAPASGRYNNNPHAGDIDWQIEANFAGLVAPGQPEAAIDIAWRAGHVVGYGDGVYGGVAVAAMQSTAFIANSVGEIVEAGRQAVPEGSQYRQVIEDVIAGHQANPADWTYTWQIIQNKWGEGDRCPEGIDAPFNISANLNGAYVFMGLLYGNGNFEKSMRIAMRCGQDSDCNPSTVGGILGTWLGRSQIPYKFQSHLSEDAEFQYFEHTYRDAIHMSTDVARQILVLRGGRVEGSGADEVWYLPPEKPIEAPVLEQWPTGASKPPHLAITVEEVSGRTITLQAASSTDHRVSEYQWYFGDLSYASGEKVTHTYHQDGTYQVIGYASDINGNTAWKAQWVQIDTQPTSPTPGGAEN